MKMEYIVSRFDTTRTTIERRYCGAWGDDVIERCHPPHLVLVPLLAHLLHLRAQLPQFLLEDLGGAVGLAVLLLALEGVELRLQARVLLLQIAHL